MVPVYPVAFILNVMSCPLVLFPLLSNCTCGAWPVTCQGGCPFMSCSSHCYRSRRGVMKYPVTGNPAGIVGDRVGLQVIGPVKLADEQRLRPGRALPDRGRRCGG